MGRGGGAAVSGSTGADSGPGSWLGLAPHDGGLAAAQSDAGAERDADGAVTAAERDAALPPLPLPQPSGCITDVSAGTHDVACAGITQHLTISKECLTRRCGLIIDVHGGTMSAQMEDHNTQLSVLGPAHGYVVIQPSAGTDSSTAGLWNAATDDAKILAFIKTAISVFRIDDKRVHMTGFSQGGYMTWRFICHDTDLLASAAPAAAAGAAKISIETDCSLTGTDKPSRELDILYMHGTKDNLVDFANAKLKRDAVVALYGLDAGTQIAGDGTYRRTRYKNAKGTLFEFIDHDYSATSPITIGHCYPGSPDQDPAPPGQLMSFGCVPPNSFTWGQEVVAFFMAHPKS